MIIWHSRKISPVRISFSKIQSSDLRVFNRRKEEFAGKKNSAAQIFLRLRIKLCLREMNAANSSRFIPAKLRATFLRQAAAYCCKKMAVGHEKAPVMRWGFSITNALFFRTEFLPLFLHCSSCPYPQDFFLHDCKCHKKRKDPMRIFR